MSAVATHTVFWEMGMTLETLEGQVIRKAYRMSGNNKTRTAQVLGISVRTLDERLKRYEADDKAAEDVDEVQRKKDHDWLMQQRYGSAYKPKSQEEWDQEAKERRAWARAQKERDAFIERQRHGGEAPKAVASPVKVEPVKTAPVVQKAKAK